MDGRSLVSKGKDDSIWGNTKRHGRTILLLTVGILSVATFFYKFDIGKIMALISITPKRMIWMALLLHLLTLLLGALKWNIMLKGIGEYNDKGFIFKIHVSSVFFDNITPGAKMGGEGIRLYLMRNILDVDYASAVGLLSLDKVVTLLPLIVMAVLAIIWQWQILGKVFISNKMFITIMLLLTVTGIVVGIMLRAGWPSKGDNSDRFSRIRLFLADSGFAFRLVFADRRRVLFLLLASTTIWICYPIKIYILAMAMGMDISFSILSSISIIAYLVGMLPLSPGGLGSYDAAMGKMLFLLGVGETAIGSLILLYRLTSYFFSLSLGGIATIDLLGKIRNNKILTIREDIRAMGERVEQISLADLELGKRGVLTKIDGGRKMARRLETLGLRPGKEVHMTSTVFNNGPVIIDLDGRLIAIGRGQAHKIYVRDVRSD